jgi:hypothetical protein
MFFPLHWALGWAFSSFNLWGELLHLWPTFKPYMDPLFLLLPWRGNGLHPTTWFKMFLSPLQKAWGFMFHVIKPMSFHHLPFNLLWTSWHHVISWWHLHLSWCSHRRSHLSRFGFSNCFISRDGHKNGDSSKGRISSQLTPNKHVLSPCHRGFWVHTPTSIWLSLWIC